MLDFSDDLGHFYLLSILCSASGIGAFFSFPSFGLTTTYIALALFWYIAVVRETHYLYRARREAKDQDDAHS